MKTIAVYRCQGTDNVGDLNCSPASYFDFPGIEHHDPKHSNGGPVPTDADLYIFGGGAITSKAASCAGTIDKGIKVAWGIGQSMKSGEKYCHTTPLNDWDRYGVRRAGFTLNSSRDINVEDTEWVPCASCMSPLFDLEYEEKYDTVVYLNGQDVFESPMVMNNRQSFEKTIAFIGSGRVVMTDSYHGAYWATLLGKTAVVVNPYSSKFYQFKHQPMLIESVRYLMTAPVVYPEALEECRAANITFNDKVQELIGNG